MSEWKEVELGSVAEYRKEKIEAVFLNCNNYVSTDNMLSDKQGITSSGYVPTSGKSSKFSKNNILVSNIRPYFKKIWFADKNGGCSNDVIVFQANEKLVDPKFLFYQLSKDEFFDFVMAGSNGTKMPRGNKNSIPTYKLLLPPLPTQKRIASILSAYDDLIENNLKRIKLLEELAQRTYEEWFVKFRINGKQLAVGDNGLPDGWERKRTDEFCNFLNGYAYYTKGYSESGHTVLDLGNIAENSDLQISGKEKFIDDDLYEATKKFHLKKYDVLIAMTDVTSALRILGKTAIVNENDKYVLNQRVGCLRSIDNKIDYSIIYALFNDYRFISKMKAVSKGAVQFYFNTKDVVEFEHILPSNDFLREFEKVYKPYLELRINLKEQNQLLKESRDILLPRLLSGKIEVTGEVLGMVAEPSEEYAK